MPDYCGPGNWTSSATYESNQACQEHDEAYGTIGSSYPHSWVNPAYYKYNYADERLLEALSRAKRQGRRGVTGAIAQQVFKFKKYMAPTLNYRHKKMSNYAGRDNYYGANPFHMMSSAKRGSPFPSNRPTKYIKLTPGAWRGIPYRYPWQSMQSGAGRYRKRSYKKKQYRAKRRYKRSFRR